MKQKTITVEIDTDGNIKIEGHNFAGASCEKATKFLEDALGAKISSTRKPEFTQSTVQQQTINQ